MDKTNNKTNIKTLKNKRIKKHGKWITDEVQTKFKGVRVFRTKHGGNFWQFSCWITEEKKYYTKSLRTEDLEEALEKAEELYIEIRALAKQGQKLFPISLEELIDRFLKHQNERVLNELITKERYITISSQLNALKRFLENVISHETRKTLKTKDIKINKIQGKHFLKYTNFRLEEKIKLVTIRNERSTITNLFDYGCKQGLASHNQLPEWEELKRVPIGQRESFTAREWSQFHKASRLLKDREKNKQKKLEREIFHKFIEISANTGIRFGELRKLKWTNILKVYTIKNRQPDDPEGKLVDIYLPAHITKNRKERTAVGLAGESVQKLKKLKAPFDKPEDYIFCDTKNGIPLSKRFYYKYWEEVLAEAGLSDIRLTPYSLRHFFATMRLIHGDVNIYDLSKVMGCSVAFIEKHYSHVRTPDIARRIVRVNQKEADEFESVNWKLVFPGM